MNSNKRNIDIESNFKVGDTIAYSCSITFRSLDLLPECLREKEKLLLN